jgi:hypothetical protein
MNLSTDIAEHDSKANKVLKKDIKNKDITRIIIIRSPKKWTR